MKRVVLDTYVVASACFWRGVCWHCLEAWVGGRFTALLSPPILMEYTEVFAPSHSAQSGRLTAAN